MNDRVSYSVENHIAHIRLIRADKMNALDDAMIGALIEAGEQLKADKTVRCAILSGEGRAFCAGLDMANFSRMASGGSGSSVTGKKSGRLAERTHGITNRPQHCAWVWREAQVPVIAAVHGVALGGGFQIMCGADIRYAARDTRFSIMEIRWGLIPDMGTTHVMARLAREDKLKELALTGRIFEAPEAHDTGFVTRVCDDPLAAAQETAELIASKNPEAIIGIKELFNSQADRFAPEMLMQESVLQDDIIGAPNQIEAVMAELEKRPAKYA
jgi:enoyl-CoA hydratase/carnithine racemase